MNCDNCTNNETLNWVDGYGQLCYNCHKNKGISAEDISKEEWERGMVYKG